MESKKQKKTIPLKGWLLKYLEYYRLQAVYMLGQAGFQVSCLVVMYDILFGQLIQLGTNLRE